MPLNRWGQAAGTEKAPKDPQRDLHLLRFGTEDQKQVLVTSLFCRAPTRPDARPRPT